MKFSCFSHLMYGVLKFECNSFQAVLCSFLIILPLIQWWCSDYRFVVYWTGFLFLCGNYFSIFRWRDRRAGCVLCVFNPKLKQTKVQQLDLNKLMTVEKDRCICASTTKREKNKQGHKHSMNIRFSVRRL